MKKLYKIWQTVNNGYDTYSDAVVCATSEEEARQIHPSGYYCFENGKLYFKFSDDNKREEEYIYSGWCELKDVKVEEIGVANGSCEIGEVICSSFHAG